MGIYIQVVTCNTFVLKLWHLDTEIVSYALSFQRSISLPLAFFQVKCLLAVTNSHIIGIKSTIPLHSLYVWRISFLLPCYIQPPTICIYNWREPIRYHGIYEVLPKNKKKALGVLNDVNLNRRVAPTVLQLVLVIVYSWIVMEVVC